MKKMKDLKYHYGLKVRIYPNSVQKKIIKLNSDASRAVYNEMVGINLELFRLKQVNLYIDTIVLRINQLEKRRSQTKHLKNYLLYLNDPRIDSNTVANAKQNYSTAWKNWKKVHRAGTPNFHKKSYRESYQTNAHYSKDSAMDIFSSTGVRFIDLNHIQLPKLGRLRISGSHKRILSNKTDIRLGTVTVSKDTADRYFASFQLGSDTPFVEKFAKTGKQLGVDLNLDNFLTDSNGAMVANPRFYRKAKRQLAKAQRKLGKRCARAKKEGRSLRTDKNYQKQRLLVARLHDRIRNQRSDFINRLTTALIKSHDLVVAERLMSNNMAKNHALAMSITDAGWREFLAKMEVKANLYGKTFLMIDPKNTTQRCSSCGHIMGKNGTEKLTLKDREWTCPKCGTYHIRDWNAAKNILDKGLAKIAKEKPAKVA